RRTQHLSLVYSPLRALRLCEILFPSCFPGFPDFLLGFLILPRSPPAATETAMAAPKKRLRSCAAVASFALKDLRISALG
ncbi:MAG: hypothetical protein WBK37_04020, partial [Kiritimatiellia bacterium]